MKVVRFEELTNAQLDELAVSTDRQSALRFKFRLLRNLPDDLPQKDWLIKRVVAKNETSAWIAPPGGLKSALLCELAFAVASKTDWHGYKAKNTGAVVYFALERAELVDRRLRAYRAKTSEEADAPPIAVVPGMVNLMDQGTVKDVIASVRAVEQETENPVVLIIFDTFAKLIAAGGGDENLAKDQGRVFANLQRVKDELGCHIALIGHTGKDETKGSRGSNAILGDVDLMVTISGDDVKTATVTKANDAPEGPLFSFKSELHEFGVDEDGAPVTVNVVSADEISSPQEFKSNEPTLTANQRTFFRILHDAGPNGLRLEEWNEQARDLGIGEKRKATLHDLRKALEDRGLVRPYGDRWKVNHDG
jgi:hypothetical protein